MKEKPYKRVRYPYLVLFTLWLMVFSSSSQVMIIAPILPRIGEELGIETSLLGMLMTAYAVAVGLFALVTGPISDHYGRRRVMLVGTALMTVSLALHVLARDYYTFLALRTLAGAAGGVLSGAAVAFVGDYCPVKRRGWANGWIMTGLAAGQIGGIPIGTLLAARFGFQSPFVVFAVAMGVTFVLIWFLIPGALPSGGGERLTLATALRSYGALLRRGDVVAATAAFLFMFLSISLFVIYLPTWLAKAGGFSPNKIASLYFVGGFANVLTGPRVGKLSDRVGRKRVILASSLGLAVVMVMAPWALAVPWAIYGLFFVAMALMASRASPFQTLLTEIVSGEQRGSLISLTVAVGQIGFGLGGALAGLSYARYGFFSNAVLSAVAVLLTGGLVWFYLPEPRIAAAAAEGDPSVRLPAQGELGGPSPEGGYLAKSLQESCAEKADGSIQLV